MTINVSNDKEDIYKKHIQDRLEFLDQQEKQLKEKLEKGKEKEKQIAEKLEELKKKVGKMVQKAVMEGGMKDSEIRSYIEKTLSSEDQHMLKEELQGKSKQEAEQMIKKEKNNPKRKNIWKLIVGLGITVSIIRGIYQYAQQDKNKKNTDTEEIITQPDNQNDSTTKILPEKDLINIDSLKVSISRDKLSPLITYEKLAEVINNIQKDEVKKALIQLLYQGKIIEAQEMFGMKRTSQYTSNKATGKIDANTLERFGHPYFGLYEQEIFKNTEIPQEVKDIYQKFLSGEINNNGANYIILCKSDFYLYLFTKDHKLVYRQVTLLGDDMEKSGERVPYPGYNTNQGYIYHDKAVNRDTPEGLFKIQKTCTLGNNYTCDGPKVGLVAVPINIKTQKIEERYEYQKYEKRFHPIRKPSEDPDKYQEAFDSEETSDNAISHGCPNTNIGILIDNITIGKSVEYTTHK